MMHDAERIAPRVAFLHPSRGPITERDWSGTPLGLVTAMRGLGVEVIEVGYKVPTLVRRLAHVVSRVISHDLTAAERSSIKIWLRRRTFQNQLDRLGHLDGVLAVGTDCYELERLVVHAPVATYDDTTLSTMWESPESDTSNAGFRERDVRRWIETQARSARAATVNCASTTWAARSIVSDYGVPSDRVVAVGMGHRPRTAGPVVARDWSVPVFLFVGVDWRRKNGEAVVRAFEAVRRVHRDATLHLVGRHAPVSGPGIVDHGLLARDDPEAQNTLDNLLARATAFVLPSRFDPSPIAYLEAASAGIPVIATSEGGAGELLGEAAIVVSPFDDAALFNAMLTLSGPEEARRRGELAKERAAESTWEHVASRILAALGVSAGETERVQ
ncbi:glycosyltransferase [Microbacterium protaetiae]|uniref:Glycosyltransferase n=1 Tax=Microbacterium protaetiae TaxID=2509458 RepID=A0A4P6EF04_9MICO|nr:glycosyltransferase family 4 protein [Microbacterium protaetiae]QAY59973.1 glycosyltransferase [Microbacterium protaetiae]